MEGVDVAQGQHEAMTVDAALNVVGGATIALGLLSTTLKRVWLSVPLAALALGVLLGPEVLGVVHLGGREQAAPGPRGARPHHAERLARRHRAAGHGRRPAVQRVARGGRC